MNNTKPTAKRGAKPLAPVQQIGPVIDPELIAQRNQALQHMAGVQADLHDAALVTAREIGYDGEISIGALEDGIRFYQRRTAEACLELGKRLILLKELTPHGEFEERSELLGFTARTAQRFMTVAAKVSKSATMSLLAGHAKGINALLELVTCDDNELETLKNLDDIERMSPSQLRAAIRKAREKAIDETAEIEQRDAEIGELKKKVSAAGRAWVRATPDEQSAKLRRAVEVAALDVRTAITAHGTDYGLGGAVRAYAAHATEHNIDIAAYLGGAIHELITDLCVLRDDPDLGIAVPILAEQHG